MTGIGGISLVGGAVPVTVDLLAAAILLAVVLAPSRVRWIGIAAAGAATGALLGLGLCWLLSDRLDLFEVDLSPVSRGWCAAAVAGVGALATAVVRGGAARRVLGSVGIVVVLLAGALGVNADVGQYTTLGSLGGQPAAGPLAPAVLAAQRREAPGTRAGQALLAPGPALALRGTAAADRPPRGVIGTVHIPAPASHFPARPAYVYLPPGALTADPQRLPVLILLSGQPGGPDIMARAGRVAAILDAYAAAHDGLAPIVVIPDQLGAPGANPMCVDSPIGNSATYLTRDVPDWILTHLAVEPRVGAWAIGGFSQGGTCTIQLGAGHPELFSALLDISGQVAPANGTLAQTIDRGFGGSAAAYRAALPETLLAAHAPYRDTVGVFTSGSLDARYGPGSIRIAAAARAAGMTVTRLASPGTAHDWATVRWSLSHGLPAIAAHLGLQGTP